MSLEEIIKRCERVSISDRKIPMSASIRESVAKRIRDAALKADISPAALLGELASEALNGRDA